jgi:hypothetical protein
MKRFPNIGVSFTADIENVYPAGRKFQSAIENDRLSGLDESVSPGQARRLMSSSPAHPNDPLHGITLETVLQRMVDRHGWERMADQIPIRCFMFDPTIKSSLTFLRKNPWARKKLEDWYVYDVTRGWIDGQA